MAFRWTLAVPGLFLGGLLLGGCSGDPVLKVSVDGGRNLIYESTSAIEMGLEGAVEGKTKVNQKLTWSMDFANPGKVGQGVAIECQKVSIEGASKGPIYDAKILQNALETLRLDLVIDSKGRTISVAERDLGAQGRVVAATASAATASMRTLGPLGIVYSAEPMSKGKEWKTSVDLAQASSILAGDDAATEGSSEYTFRFEGMESTAGRTAARISYKHSSRLSATLPIAKAPVAVTSTLTETGVFIVDARTGLPLSQTFESETKTDVGSGVLVQKEKGELKLASSPE